MSTTKAAPNLATGLAAFLSAECARPIRVSHLLSSSAGARRSNVLFDADDGDQTWHLVATIIPTSEIQLNPIGAEAAVRALAEKAGVPVPHVYATCLDESNVGGPFFISDR
ncbi:MAG TPA: hypothetical protein VLL25_16055, partial [Acidimicrobiales bacterium]|nr:hypothetical protein [Acidimicrobiales bacterium]